MKENYSVLTKKVIKEIHFELEEIENLFDLYRNELFDIKHVPNRLELTGMASILHSFYCGIEKIFLNIAKNIDNSVPFDINWHKTLLFQIAEGNEYREAVISEKTKIDLSDYLAFRHFYRHSYSSHLEWEKMEILVKSIQPTWEKFYSEISSFLKAYEKPVKR